MTAALCWALALCAAMEVETVPVDLARATCFVAALDDTGPADLFILDGQTLAIHEDTIAGAPRTVRLPEGSGALDVADVDGDGRAEVVVVSGEEVLLYRLTEDPPAEPTVLLTRRNQFSDPAPTPRVHVLVAPWNGASCVALPTDSALELYGADGALLEAFPMGLDAPHAALYGQPFRATPISSPVLGGEDSLEFRVGRVLAIKPQLPETLHPAAPGTEAPPYNPTRRARDAARLPLDQWPTLPLGQGAGMQTVAAFAVDDGPPMETLVRVRATLPREGVDHQGFGPVRRYPGALLMTTAPPPDFGGDGHADLLLWSAPTPNPTVANLSRATTRGVWPLHLNAHAYVAEKSRFDPRPLGRISVEVPAAWFMAGGIQGPMRHVVLRDFDGDGRTDVGMATAADTYAVWLAGPEGFARQPDFSRQFDGPILGIAFEARLHGSGQAALGLRGLHALHILRATPRPGMRDQGPPAGLAPLATGPRLPEWFPDDATEE